MLVTILCLLVSMIIAYLLGSVNFALIITKGFAHKDIRSCGSGNAGMTNVLRTLGKGPAALTLLGDFSKGLFAVLIARALFVFVAKQPDFFVGEYLCAFCGLLGHCFPVFFGFKGGKGILVSAGALIALSPLSFAFCLAAFLIGTLLTKYVSVGSIAAAVTFPVAVLMIRLIGKYPHPYLEASMALLIGGIVIFMHRANIKRLIRGEENGFGKKKKS
jgi:glycerol-3-phosphate acyltransferase PlsY